MSTQGYGDGGADLATAALWLGRMLMPDELEAIALPALMPPHDSRRSGPVVTTGSSCSMGGIRGAGGRPLNPHMAGAVTMPD
jgi:predicted RNA polymerase sigma factor